MSNIYYNPEKFGLVIVGEVEFSSDSYGFDTSVVWRDVETGALYYGDDSGCSCPCPFEDTGCADLHKVERTQDLIDYFEGRKGESYLYDPEHHPEMVSEIDAAVGELILKAGVAR